MSRFHYALLLTLCSFTFAVPARASLFDQWCKIIFDRISAMNEDSVSTKWLRDATITANLKALLARHLEEIAPGAEKFLHALPKGSLIEVNGVKYKVLAYLGGGVEGAVYLADGPDGKRSIKQFNGKTEIQDHYRQLERLAGMGIRAPQVWGVDPRNQTAAVEYIEGVPVNILFSNGLKHGLTKKQLSEMQVRFDRFKGHVLGLGQKINDANVIMNLTTGEFVIVDPI